MSLVNKIGLDVNKVYYLASPYSHPDDERMQARYEAIDYIAALLIVEGAILIEPIAMCHMKSLKYDLPSGYEYWKTRDRTFVERCDGIIITKLEGWEKSVGMKDELLYALSLGKHIIEITENDFTEEQLDELYIIYEAERVPTFDKSS